MWRRFLWSESCSTPWAWEKRLVALSSKQPLWPRLDPKLLGGQRWFRGSQPMTRAYAAPAWEVKQEAKSSFHKPSRTGFSLPISTSPHAEPLLVSRAEIPPSIRALPGPVWKNPFEPPLHPFPDF